MIKKLIIILVALLPSMVQAQVAVGGWTLYSPFLGVDDISETNTYVYYRSGSSLYRIDKATMEVTSMNVANYLNDSNITGIFDDRNKKSIIVAYESGNMDRLYDNGSILNIPDIKDAVISGSRKINDIAFGKDNFYVAADFGLVTYSDKKNEVNESMFTPKPVNFVATPGDLTVIHYDTRMHFAKQSVKITSLDKIPVIASYTRTNMPTDMVGFGDNGVLVLAYDQIYALGIDMDNQSVKEYWIQSLKNPGQNVKGLYKKLQSVGTTAYAVNTEGIYELKTPVEPPVLKELPRTDANTIPLSFIGDLASIWIGEENGMKQVDYTGADPVVLHSGIKGSDLTVPAIHAMHVGTSGKIYVYNLGEQESFGLKSDQNRTCKVNTVENGVIKDVSAFDVGKDNKNGASQTAPYVIKFNYNLVEDPLDPDAYYIGSFFEGLFRIKNGKQTHKFYTHNSVIADNGYACCVMQPLIDKNNNLWVYKFGGDGEAHKRFCILGSDKRLSDNSKTADWKERAVSGWLKDNRGSYGIVCQESDYILFCNGRYSKDIVIFDTKGTADTGDDTYRYVNTYVNQDGKELSFDHMICMVEDTRGRIWVGTSNGVFEITDPAVAVNASTINVNQLKVPRNDGTNLADYLLSSQLVSSITIDPANRKWISTIGSGVYLVSENGDEILEHFTEANSILPNTVYAVACDPNSNKVYFGTDIGLIEYSSTSAPGSDNYDDVYAYPNPVRPDFTGWITVTGLMDNSLVKIADAAGNVFYQGRSDGGMFTWDGCNPAGERVKTGVYYVYASQNATGDASACVTKIMVVN